ncbi:MAG: hypothetical protein WC551_11665 [Patescibacteria group bacterium]
MGSTNKRKFTHRELAEYAGKWLRSKRHRTVFIERQSRHETPDAIGWTHLGVSTLIECKTSRADFLADQRKAPRSCSRIGIGAFRYYLAPRGVLTVKDIPPDWGLLEVYGQTRVCIRVVRVAVKIKLGVHQLRNEMKMLISELALYQGIPAGAITPMESRRVKEIQEHLHRLSTLDNRQTT